MIKKNKFQKKRILLNLKIFIIINYVMFFGFDVDSQIFSLVLYGIV